MSSFAGLNTALSSLIAQRQALEVTGQNIANVNTPGYTRQRASLHGVDGATAATLHTQANSSAGGVKVAGIERLGDMFLQTRVRQEASTAERAAAIAETWSRMETGLREPGEQGMSAKIDEFFGFWADVANQQTENDTPRSVLLTAAEGLVTDLQTDYLAVRTQWETLRDQASAQATEINGAAAAVADLNARIKSITAGGGSPNQLIDERDQLITTLSGLTGAEARYREDGTVDVMVGGNALVRGSTASEVAIHGTTTFSELPGVAGIENPGPDDGVPRLVWAGSGSSVGATGGTVAGMLEGLGPADLGGPLASLAQTYNELALDLARTVNDLHTTGRTTEGEPGDPFFTEFDEDYNGVAVMDLAVLLDHPNQIAAAAEGGGPYDGSIADQISQIPSAQDLWSRAVVDIGTSTRAAVGRAEATEFTRASAEGQLLSATAVDTDEETVNLLMHQRGYEAAARLMTVVDQMLDTLINRTGVVGR